MNVSYSVQSFLNCSVSVIGALLVVVAVTPGMLAAIFVLGIIYYRVQVGCCLLVGQAALQLKHVAACWSFTWHASSMLLACCKNYLPCSSMLVGLLSAPHLLLTHVSISAAASLLLLHPSFCPAHCSSSCLQLLKPAAPSAKYLHHACPLGGAALLSPVS